MKGDKVLRISVTDRCNLRCIYCMPESGVNLSPSDELLSYEEIELIGRAALDAGISKFRITGGEPLVRKGIIQLVEKLARLDSLDLALTTNGILLAEFAHSLKQAGLKRVTVSLDTLRKDRFEKIARRDGLEKIFTALDNSRKAGLAPIKINTVIIRGVNDDEILDFVRFGQKEKVEVRFIELMPFAGLNSGCKELGRWNKPLLVKGNEIKAAIEKEFGPLIDSRPEQGVAKIFQTESGAKVGLITPISDRFCDGCQRLRLGPEGKLRICLFDEQGIDLRKELRERKADQDQMAAILSEAFSRKNLWERGDLEKSAGEMFRIGG